MATRTKRKNDTPLLIGTKKHRTTCSEPSTLERQPNISPFYNGKTTNCKTLKTLHSCASTYTSTTHWIPGKPNQFIHAIDKYVWTCALLPFIGYRALSTMHATSKFFHQYWQDFLTSRQVKVPEDVPTLNLATELAFTILCHRTLYTPESPLNIVLGPGEHTIDDEWTSSFSDTTYKKTLSVPFDNVRFLGTDPDPDNTTVLGQFVVENDRTGVTFQNLTVRSNTGMGLYVTGKNARSSAENCAFTHCKYSGLYVTNGAYVTTKRCAFAYNAKAGAFCMGNNTTVDSIDSNFHDNENEGLLVYDHGTWNLHGSNTLSSQNKTYGISVAECGTVNVYLPKNDVITENNRRLDISTTDCLLSEVGGTIRYFPPVISVLQTTMTMTKKATRKTSSR